MQLIIISSIATIIVSTVQILKASKQFIKKIFDEGYKFNFKRTVEINNILNRVEDDEESNLLTIFIPYYNLFYAAEFTRILENRSDEIIRTVVSMGVIEKMNDYEEIEYNRNPKFSTGMLIEEIVEEKLLASKKILVKDGLKESELIYRGKEVIYATRYLKDKSNEELLKILNDANRQLAIDVITKEYESIDNFCEALKKDSSDVILKLAIKMTEIEEYNYSILDEENMKKLEENENKIVNVLGPSKVVIDLSNTEEKNEVLILKKKRK